MRKIIEIAKYGVLEAGSAVMDVYESGGFHIKMKEGEMPVTAADRLSHEIIVRHLEKTGLPVLSEEGKHIEFIERAEWDYYWLIDPLDGTKEFIDKNGEFTINIALMLRDRPVAGIIYVPVTDVMYVGSEDTGVYKYERGEPFEFEPLPVRRHFRDILEMKAVNVVASRSHLSVETKLYVRQFSNVNFITMGSSLKFMSVLEGKADIYPRIGTTMEWDTAAAHAILNAANRGVYHMDLGSELRYNKPLLTNPYFVSF